MNGRGAAILRADRLTKSYGGRRVVNDVSIEVRAGEMVGLLGPNGAGKTTTFYMIVGLARPDAGRVFLNGDDVTELPMYQRARRGISYLPQEPSVFRKLTVEENILAILETLPTHARGARERLGAARGARHRAPGKEQGAFAVRRRATARRDHPCAGDLAPRSCCSTSRSPASTRSPWWTSRTS